MELADHTALHGSKRPGNGSIVRLFTANVIGLTLCCAGPLAAQTNSQRLPPPQDIYGQARLAPLSVHDPRAKPNAGGALSDRLPAPRKLQNRPGAGEPVPAASAPSSVTLSQYLGHEAAQAQARGREAASFQSDRDLIQRLISYQERKANGETDPAAETQERQRPVPGNAPPMVLEDGSPAAPRSRWGQLPVSQWREEDPPPVLPEPAAARAIAASYPDENQGGSVLAGTDAEGLRLQPEPSETDETTQSREPSKSRAPRVIPKVPGSEEAASSSDEKEAFAGVKRGFPQSWFAESSDARPVQPRQSAPVVDFENEELVKLRRENEELKTLVNRQKDALDEVRREMAELREQLKLRRQTPEKVMTAESTMQEDAESPASAPQEPLMAGPEGRLPAPASLTPPEQPHEEPEKADRNEDELDGAKRKDGQASLSLREQLLARTQADVRLAKADSAPRN